MHQHFAVRQQTPHGLAVIGGLKSLGGGVRTPHLAAQEHLASNRVAEIEACHKDFAHDHLLRTVATNLQASFIGRSPQRFGGLGCGGKNRLSIQLGP